MLDTDSQVNGFKVNSNLSSESGVELLSIDEVIRYERPDVADAFVENDNIAEGDNKFGFVAFFLNATPSSTIAIETESCQTKLKFEAVMDESRFISYFSDIAAQNADFFSKFNPPTKASSKLEEIYRLIKIALEVKAEEQTKKLEVLEGAVASEKAIIIHHNDETSLQESNELDIVIDHCSGSKLTGWFKPDSEDGYLTVAIGSGKPLLLGLIWPTLGRPDVQAAYRLPTDLVGFIVPCGGILQFLALTEIGGTLSLQLQPRSSPPLLLDVNSIKERLRTFSPLLGLKHAYDVTGIDLVDVASAFPISVRFTFLAKEHAVNRTVTFFQVNDSGELVQVGEVLAEGQIGSTIVTDVNVVDDGPILIIIIDVAGTLLASDTLPYPAFCSRENAPFVEYHSLVGDGEYRYNVIAKLSRNAFDWMQSKADRPVDQAVRENTLGIVYSREVFDVSSLAPHSIETIVSQVFFLNENGMFINTEFPEGLSFKDLSIAVEFEHVLFSDMQAYLRADFWPIMSKAILQDPNHFDRILWNSLIEDATSGLILRPNLEFSDPIFERHSLPRITSTLMSKAAVLNSIERNPEYWRSGFGVVEYGCLGVPMKSLRVREVMDYCRADDLTHVKVLSDRFSQLELVSTRSRTPNCSVVINFRDCCEQTKLALSALSLQKINGIVEVILIDNDSLLANVTEIEKHAITLFGRANIQLYHYEGKFNHSAQTNIGVRLASHDFVLHLSNDAILITENALETALEIAQLDNVATVGFHICTDSAQRMTESVGLEIGEIRHILAGRCPMRRKIPLDNMKKNTQVVAGNTFACALTKKKVFLELGELDEAVFPTNYNDVDFCLRALAKDFKHIAIGDCYVRHQGRGSREADFELQESRRLLERVPQLHALEDFSNIKL